jgi:hypothetical protein
MKPDTLTDLLRQVDETMSAGGELVGGIGSPRGGSPRPTWALVRRMPAAVMMTVGDRHDSTAIAMSPQAARRLRDMLSLALEEN